MALEESEHAERRPPRPNAGGQRKRAGEIVDAAARVFAERGYHGTSTQDIADALGLRQASLYYYFHSKEAALEAVCERGVHGFLEMAETIVASPATPREKIERLILAHLKPIETRKDYVRVFINERRYLPGPSRKRIGRVSRRLEGLFQAVIEIGMDTGDFRSDLDPRLVTLSILGMCNAVINWRSEESGLGAAVLAKEISALVLSGVTARKRRQGDRARASQAKRRRVRRG